MANVIIPKGDSLGKTRSEHERNMRKYWDVKSMNDEQLDKLKFIEKKRKEKWGFDKQFVGLETVNALNQRKMSKDEMEKRAEELRKAMND